MTIKAIETVWKGYRFRSRLEARWAVFFDRLGVEWEYEPEGFEDGEGNRYLPDFRFKDRDGHYSFAEVKGDPTWLNGGAKCTALVPRKELLLLGNIPDPTFGLLFLPALRWAEESVTISWLACCTKGDAIFLQTSDVARFVLGMNQPSNAPISPRDDGEHVSFQPRIAIVPFAFGYVIDAGRDAKAARFEHGEAP